jgi:hypothetical protein
MKIFLPGWETSKWNAPKMGRASLFDWEASTLAMPLFSMIGGSVGRPMDA